MDYSALHCFGFGIVAILMLCSMYFIGVGMDCKLAEVLKSSNYFICKFHYFIFNIMDPPIVLV